jgi:hypothetical protein
MYATVRIRVPLIHIEPYKTLAVSEGNVLVRSVSAVEGVTSEAGSEVEILSVPVSAVIDTGVQKVVYVEREAGVFEGIAVALGARTGDFYPIIKGLEPGDRVATAGAFLLDAETRLNPAAAAAYFGAGDRPQGREPSAPNTTPSAPSSEPSAPAVSPDIAANLNQLPDGDRQLAVEQRLCPVTGSALGSMGVPYRVSLKGAGVFLCCPGCEQEALSHSDEVLRKALVGQNSHGGDKR